MIENNELTLVLILVALAATLAGRLLAKRWRLHWRSIPAYVVLPESAADAVESDNRIHFSMGSSAIGQASTVSALVTAELVYRLSQRLVVSRQTPLITVSDPVTLTLAQDTLRRAYEYRCRIERYHSRAAAWYPQGARSLVFAAGVSSLAADADVSRSVLLGRFGYELALLGESALRHGQVLIAHSDRIEGQAVAFAQAQQVLIGEELYVGPAYMNGRLIEQGSVIALDLLRWLVIVGVLITALQAL
ncbi:MAG: hypothetical protein JW966_07275 [Anaerolineae bacterium]|nr:hypothetical protein [Anaerolineae bacterium]